MKKTTLMMAGFSVKWIQINPCAWMMLMIFMMFDRVVNEPISTRTLQKLNHLRLDTTTGELYVGGMNRLYKFDGDLSQIGEDVITGPKLDHPGCFYPFGGSTCKGANGEIYTTKQTDNYNKILLIDYTNGKVIVCGSIYQGTCELFRSDLSSNGSYTNDQNYFIAASDEKLSTVGFIDGSALYVGSTYSGDKDSGLIRKQVPAVASYRYSGTDPFKYTAVDDFSGTGSYLKLDDTAVDQYLISYVTGFGINGFSYFLTTQRESMSATIYISKIVQVCQNDPIFSSYVEMPLVCRTSATTFNLVTSAVLTTPGEDLQRGINIDSTSKILIATFTNVRDSAVCVYTLDSIRNKFTENLQNCFTGQQVNVGEHLSANKQCTKITGYTVPTDYCGERKLNAPLSGDIALTASPIITFTNQSLTSIAVVNVNSRYTVAFLGTSNGHLKKVLLSTPVNSTEYEDQIILENSPINQDMFTSLDEKHVYLMTEYKVFRVPVQECSKRVNCSECLQNADPYCGWCSLEKKCSTMSLCRDNLLTNHWLTNRGSCLVVSDYSPKLANIHKPVTVSIKVTSLPPSQQYKCVYKTTTNEQVTVDAVVRDSNTLECPTLSDSSGLRIDQGQDHLNVTLAIKSVKTGVDFLEMPFTLYSCAEHSRCLDCTQSKFQCQWCLYDNQCRDKDETCTESRRNINHKDNCPMVMTTALLLPSGVAQDIQIAAKNLPSNVEYRCELSKSGSVLASVPATFSSSSEVVCQKMKHSTKDASEFQVMNLTVLWNTNFIVDGTVQNVTVYNCSNIAQDCTSCVVSPPIKYNCAWCSTGGCAYRETCVDPILDTNKCPQAEILQIEPATFPIDGGSIVTITGSNIGQRRADIKNVTLAGEHCTVIEYVTSRKILCNTSSVVSLKTGQISIEYMERGKYLQSNIKVEYKNPNLTGVHPRKGARSGQTLVTISGSSLDTGKDITVRLGEVNCTLISKSDLELVCRKEPHDAYGSKSVEVFFDSAKRHNGHFVIHDDPVVYSIEPVNTFRSGGRIVTIRGENLDTSLEPKIYIVTSSWKSNASSCKGDAGTLTCPYPAVPSRVRRQTDTPYTISLDIDGVPHARNISAFFPDVSSSVTVHQDPHYDSFNGTKNLEGNTLTLTGNHLDLACNHDDVNVMIGLNACKIDSIQREKLICTPPADWHKQQQSPSEVTVTVGNLVFKLGKLQFKAGIDEKIWISTSAVGGGTLIFIIIIVVVVYKRRNADAERQNKKLQIQLDSLESNVRNECKQAFAELQTEVSDFTSDLNVIGIPFWDYKMYTFRVLFPGLKSHPVLIHGPNSTINKFGGYEQGLHQFNQLLNSKQFLLIFIRTLEQQKNFSIRDKSIVASLLMIVLQDKMEYATEILKALLNELIDKSVEKKHPKLMLRRTESVVEKLLSNWLSLSMYSYLKKHVGKMLFMLFKAIKHQTEKGPVDVFTSEAKYSLSEDRLLREKVQPQTLNLHVIMSDMKEPVAFKALDCDTVTQAKEKAIDAIYMNAPFSSRPAVHELDIEWKSGRSGQLPLQDEDVTTQVINGWKRVNSLAHYHVPDGAVLVFIPSKTKNDLIRQVHGKIEIANSQSSLPPIVTMEEGTKVWHLVKHDDNQNLPRTQKVISEIFLTRLLSTKGTLQQYIDDLFMTILRADNGLPPAVKYLFDFLDNAAKRHNIADTDVVHTWKSNSLPLRFWVNIIKNPEFIFDINKSNIVDSCLSVIAQTFMDSCSTAEHKLGKDSPSNKLLFAKDIPRFRGWVSKFYKSVGEMVPITDQEMTQVMTEMSMTNQTDFNVSVALQDLYKYAMQYNFELLEALDDDPSAKRLHLANRFEQVQAVIEGTPLY